MEFEFEKLPYEETIAGLCPKEKEVYNAFGYTRITPSKCVVPSIYVDSLQPIRDFEIREDDVFVVSNPKCGTTWCMEMVWLVGNSGDTETALTIPLDKRVFYLDAQGLVNQRILDLMVPGGNVLKTLTAKPSPRFFKSHLPKALLPTQIWEKKTKVIFIMREPKDAAVSNYHHYKLFHSYEGTLDQFLEAFLKDEVIYSPFWEHAIEFWKMRNEPNVLILTFEELKKDMDAVIRKTAEFLGKPLTEDQIENIKKHVSFKEMKDNKKVNYDNVREFVEKEMRPLGEGSFIREGQTGGGQNKMGEEFAKRFDDWTESKIAGTGLEKYFGRKSVFN